MTGRAFPKTGARKPSGRSIAWTRAAICRRGGSGLGLAIARDIARAHGGDIAAGQERAGRPEGDDPAAGLIAPRTPALPRRACGRLRCAASAILPPACAA